MAHLIIVILNDLARLPDLFAAWKRIGVPGVTLVNSVGGYQVDNWLQRLGLGGIGALFAQREAQQRTLISVIDDDELLERAIAEADIVVGGFDRPHSGILFVVPVGRILGLQKWGATPEAQREDAARPEADSKTRDRLLDRSAPVSEIVDVLSLEPTIVDAGASLSLIIGENLLHPSVHVVCVVNQERHLVGLIDLKSLADAFFVSIFPEKFLSELTELDEVLQFADQTHMHLASDVMREPVSVHMDDTLEKAFDLMHEHGLPGVPVVDDQHHVIGYINLLEIMALGMRPSEPGESEGA